MMQKLLYTTIVLCCCALGATAQAKPRPAVKKPAVAKPLHFRTSWGIFLSDTLPRNEVVKLLDSALTVRDGNNKTYPVVSFDFTYDQREALQDEKTKEVKVYTESTGDSFRSDKLSPLWSKHLKQTIQKGEVLFFNNIVIQYAADKFYRAPELKVTVN